MGKKGLTVIMRALLVLLLAVACSSFRTLSRYGEHYDIYPYMNEAEDHDDEEHEHHEIDNESDVDDSDNDDEEDMDDRESRQALFNMNLRPGSPTCMQRCRRNYCHRRQCRRQCQRPCRQNCMSDCGPNCSDICIRRCHAKYEDICIICPGCPPVNTAECYEMQQICQSQCRGPCNQDCDEDCRDHCRTDCRHKCIDDCNEMCQDRCLLLFDSRNSTSPFSNLRIVQQKM